MDRGDRESGARAAWSPTGGIARGPSPRRARDPPARAVAAHLAAAAVLYSVPSSAAEELRELRAALEREKERRRAAVGAAEAAHAAVEERDAELARVGRALERALQEKAAAERAAERAGAAAASVMAAGAAASASAAAAAAEAAAERDALATAALLGGGGGGGGSALVVPPLDGPMQARLRALEAEAARGKTFEAENAHLRSVAVAIQGQRDAFEGVARQLQAHAVTAEAAFSALQGEAGALMASHRVHEDALASARRTLHGYETGLTQLLTALGRQQEKIRA
jgi:hypothetical protein